MNSVKPLKVMVLEDHYYSNKIISKYINNLLARTLPEGTPFNLTTFKSGTECILNIPKNLDVAVLDYYLTHDDSDTSVNLNGHEIMRYILRMSPKCKVIMVSALKNPQIVADIKNEGVYAYIDKHLESHEEVGKAVQKAIEESINPLRPLEEV